MTASILPLEAELELVTEFSKDQETFYHSFKALGFDEIHSYNLTLKGASYHQARRLVKAGCPLALAYEILA